MPLDPGKLEAVLGNKFEFKPSDGHSDNHKWYELQLDGLPVIATRVSHNKKEIRNKLEGMIARQLRVRTPFFREMVRCTKSRDDYYEKVRKDPFPPWNERL